MKASCTLRRQPNATWSAGHASVALGAVEVSAATREEALNKLRDELQYRVELCPCSGVSGDTVVLEVTSLPERWNLS